MKLYTTPEDRQIATLTAEVARLTGERDMASARLHEVAVACATAEQKLAASETRVGVLTEAVEQAARMAEKWPAPEIAKLLRALSQPGKGESQALNSDEPACTVCRERGCNGECNLQKGAAPGASDGVQAAASGSASHAK